MPILICGSCFFTSLLKKSYLELEMFLKNKKKYSGSKRFIDKVINKNIEKYNY